MATIQTIIDTTSRKPEDIINDLKEKVINPPAWSSLVKEYDPRNHPVMSKSKYPDIANPDGTIDYVTRITYDLQRLAVKRMTELCYGIPVKRNYNAQTPRQQEAATIIENILQRNRIDSLNIERGNYLFASCEVMTLWYATKEENTLYGVKSPIKLRCRNFSPMNSEKLYPLFDENGDYIAMSIAYSIKKAGKTINYFDTYTQEQHIKWESSGQGWTEVENEAITIGKNPTLYAWRPAPIWENTSDMVYEMEWAMSRNGNYLRKNSKPAFAIFADEDIPFGSEKNQNSEFRTVLQFPKGSDAKYITWEGAIENLKFFIAELRQMFFTQLQLPDWSYESIKSSPMSGEALKQMFIDAQLKVKDEAGRLIEFHDREINVIRAFATIIAPELKSEIDDLQIETEITPFAVSDEKDLINNLTTATAGKPIVSQLEAIQYLGWSRDAKKTLEQLAEEATFNSFNLTV